jgi:hypothetical protein
MPSNAMLNPQPLPPRQVVVQVAGDTLFDLKKFNRIQESILGRLGCGGCTSGYDISWLHISQFHVDDKLNIVDLPVAGLGH